MNNLKRLYWFRFLQAAFFLMPVANVFSQSIKRIELPLSGINTAYQTVPLGEKGVLLISKPDRGTFNVQKFDTNLDRVWSIDGPVEANLDYLSSSYDGEAVFLLFSRSRSSLYQIVKVNIGPGFVETFTINTLDRLDRKSVV